MKSRPHFKITVLEDNNFYNKLINKYIDHYIGSIALDKGFTYEIVSFTTYHDWQMNFKPDTDIIITDYYLNDGYNALNLLKEVSRKNRQIKVIVISQTKNIRTTIGSILEGACEFIHKDQRAIIKSAYVVEEIINQSMNKDHNKTLLN